MTKKIIIILFLSFFATGCAKQLNKITDPADQEDDESSQINVPQTPSNKICEKLPISPDLGPGGRLYCLAVVNRAPQFCEEIKGDNEEPDGGEQPGDNPIPAGPKSSDSLQKNNQLAQPSGNGNDRGGNEESDRNLCLAHANRDPAYCQKLPDPETKKICYNVLAQISRNIDICSGIDYSQQEKQQCYFNYVNALFWEDESAQITNEDCEKVGINQSVQDRNTCLAFQQKDASLCKNNVNCLTFFPQEISFCAGKSPKGCVRDRAMTNKDLSLCEEVPRAERNGCLSGFAVHLEPDTNICDKILDLEKRQGCYIDVALALSKK
ncbi:MAG: hypothetical protein ABIC19_02790 [Patescibacteria group bacterium]|nr:hypothetical protein [Patescibacteria group bacterium]